jgi:phage-related baseplate assembly protein
MVDVQAIEAGSASSVAPDEIDTLDTPLAKVSVTNPSSILGTDEEPDDSLVKRCLAERGTWSEFGPRDAYEAAALSATMLDGSSAGITRVAVSRFSSTGQVTVVCATPTGMPTSPQLDAVTEAIEARARPDTVTVTTSGAVPHPTAHSIIVWCKGGVAATITLRAQQALAKFISTYPIGGIAKSPGGTGYLWSDAIAATVIGSSPEIYDVDFDGGAVDIPLASNEVASNVTTFDVRIQ